jgi:hypothetical protein
MAKARNAGVSGAAVAATILGILFVFALVAAIIFHTQGEKVRIERDAAETELAGWATPEQRRLDRVSAMLADRDKGSVYDQLTSEINQLRRLAAADTNVDASNLQKRMAEMRLAAGTNLLGEITRLAAELRKANELADQIRADLADAQKRAEDADRARAALSAQYDGSVKQLQGEIDKLKAQQQQYQGTVTATTAELQATIDNVRAEMQAKVDERDSMIAQLEADKRDVEGQRDRLLQITREVAVDSTIRPDGQISALVEQQGLVYVNLGRLQHMVPGLTFEVFEPGEIIKPDEFEEVRGKATIEIVKVDPHTSSARIVRTERNRSVRVGDQIVNLAFDPNVTYRFYVYGDFDIDNTGQPSLGDRRRIESMVSKFGAVVTPELSYEVDYLVLGAEPELPAPLPADTLDPELIAAHVAATSKYQRYQQLIGDARQLRIPILNQNRFLALVGFYQR